MLRADGGQVEVDGAEQLDFVVECFGRSLELVLFVFQPLSFYSDSRIFHSPVAGGHTVASLTDITLYAITASPFWSFTFPWAQTITANC